MDIKASEGTQVQGRYSLKNNTGLGRGRLPKRNCFWGSMHLTPRPNTSESLCCVPWNHPGTIMEMEDGPLMIQFLQMDPAWFCHVVLMISISVYHFVPFDSSETCPQNEKLHCPFHLLPSTGRSKLWRFSGCLMRVRIETSKMPLGTLPGT